MCVSVRVYVCVRVCVCLSYPPPPPPTRQRIRAYTVEALPAGSAAWVPFSSGTSVGNKRIDVSSDGPVHLQALRVNVTAAAAAPVIADFAVFANCTSG